LFGILREILGPSGRQGQQVTGRWEGRDETVKHLSHVPERTCIGCRAKGPRAQLLRLVIDDGRLRVDPRAVAPGRGAWIHPDPACLELAERRRAFGRALRTSEPLDVAPVCERISSRGNLDEDGASTHERPARSAATTTD